MRKALICDRWTMEFDEPPPEPLKTDRANESYVDQVFGNRLRDVSASTAAGYELLKDLPIGSRVVEFFGGVGLQTKMLEGLLSPLSHLVVEKEENCLDHLVKAFPPPPPPLVRSIRRGEARQIIDRGEFPPADIYLMDWNTFTIHQWENWAPYLEKLLATRPQAITWYDTSRPYFHLHKARYSQILGRPVDNIKDYGKAMSAFFFNLYHYSVTRAIYCPKAAYFRLEPATTLRMPVESDITYENNGFRWITE